MRSTLHKPVKISLLAGSGLLAFAASQPLQAATLNGGITFPSAQSVPGTTICFVQTSFSITGTQNDNGAGSDQIFLQSFSPTTGNGSGSNIFFANSSTVTLTRNIQFNAGFHPREPHFAKLYDLIGPAGPGQGITQIGQGQIPRSILIAAGGNCAEIAENVVPTTNAGPDQTLASGGGTVTLAGSANDGDGDAMTHSWTQISGPAVTISGANTLSPTFTAPAQINQPRTMVFRLTTTDNIGNPVTDDVSVTIAAGPNTLPTANAGADATVVPGGTQALSGSATDIDGDTLTYQWTQVSGPTVAITNPGAANASFVAPAANGSVQTLTFELVANDGFGNSAPDQVTFTVPANTTPVANAGADQSVYGLSAVTLDGTGSTDGDGDPLTYSWVQTGGTAVTLSSSTASSPTFTAPAGTGTAQNLTFDLVVSDGISSSVADSVTVTVAANRVPVANAGTDQGPIDTGSTITLNGGGSTDPDGDPLTYSWTQISGPAVTLSNPNSANPSFVAPAVSGGSQDIVFQLVVSDGQVSSAPDQVRVTVRSVGTITIVQRVLGSDGTFTYSSNVSALAGTVTTSNGVGQRQAALVPAGSYTFSVADARAAGYVVTGLSCNDSNSVTNLANRSIALSLSANENLVCTVTATNTREAALSAITNFVTARNGALLANQPDLQRRLDRLAGVAAQPGGVTAMGLPVPGSNRLPVSASYSADRSKASTSLGMVRSVADRDAGPHKFDLWAEASFGSLTYPGHKGSFRVIYAGADYVLGDNVLVGGLVQFDRFKHNNGLGVAGAAEGDGWMAGPYATVRLSSSLFLDVRAAWGGSDNRVSPLGSYVDSFETSRGFYAGSLVGQFPLGSSTELRPEIAVRYLDEKQKAYSDSFGVTIPGQSLGMGDLSFKPRVMHTFELDGGWSLRPYGEAQGILTFGSDAEAIVENALRMRVEGGIDLASPSSLRFGLSGFHDGIGSDTFRNSGIRMTVSLGF